VDGGVDLYRYVFVARFWQFLLAATNRLHLQGMFTANFSGGLSGNYTLEKVEVGLGHVNEVGVNAEARPPVLGMEQGGPGRSGGDLQGVAFRRAEEHPKAPLGGRGLFTGDENAGEVDVLALPLDLGLRGENQDRPPDGESRVGVAFRRLRGIPSHTANPLFRPRPTSSVGGLNP
jgi:hypothetical protein